MDCVPPNAASATHDYFSMIPSPMHSVIISGMIQREKTTIYAVLKELAIMMH